MTALVVLETAAVLVLAVLVAGILRSHADILNRLEELGAGGVVPVPLSGGGTAPAGASGERAHDIVGQTPQGEAAAVSVSGAAHDTLLAFLSTGCSTCAVFWQAAQAPTGVRALILTRGAEAESPAAIARLAPENVTVVMSTEAWLDYGVPGSPYFVLVRGRKGTVAAEGTADSWGNVPGLAGPDVPAPVIQRVARPSVDPDAPGRVDAELLAAGITPGHPSLFPAAQEPVDD